MKTTIELPDDLLERSKAVARREHSTLKALIEEGLRLAQRERARSALESLANGSREWAVPWPCAHDFLAIVTHPRIYRTARPTATALAQLRALRALPNLAFIAEADDPLQHLEPLTLGAKVQEAAVHDARIAAIRVAHGVAELWSADRDFARFPALRVRNPVVG